MRNGENDINGSAGGKDRKSTGTGQQDKETVRCSCCRAHLLDKRDALRRDELVKAIMKSDRTYEEVLAFLNAGEDEEQ